MGKCVMLLLGVLATACGGSGWDASRGGGDAAPADDLAASLEVSIERDSVHLTYHVTNTGGEVQTFRFPTSQRYDFLVEDAAGEELWRWSEGMAFTQAIADVRMAPGETWDFAAAWAPGGRSGVHRVTGWITATERNVRQSTTFEIP